MEYGIKVQQQNYFIFDLFFFITYFKNIQEMF